MLIQENKKPLYKTRPKTINQKIRSESIDLKDAAKFSNTSHDKCILILI